MRWVTLAAVLGLAGLSAHAGGFGGAFSSVRRGSPPLAAGANKRVATVGDSNTQGFGLSGVETYPARVQQALGSAWTVDNYGVGGTTCPQVLGNFNTNVKSLGYGTVIVMCGTNDIRTTGDSAATIYANIREIWLAAKATHAKVVALTIPPFAGASGFVPEHETRRAAINANIRAGAAAEGVTLVDIEAATSNGASPPALAHTLDGLHLDATSAQAVANVVSPLVP